MLKTILSLLTLLFSLSSSAQGDPRELIPVIDYMRTTPAWIDGHVAFKGNYKIFEDGTIKLILLKGKTIRFSLKENSLTIYPQDAFSLKYLGFTVKVKEVSWNLKQGFNTKSELPLDITGLSKDYVSRNVAESLERALGEKMKLANMQLYRLRRMKEFGTSISVVKQIVRVFATGNGPPMPTYYGEAGLTFYPDENKAFGLYGMRVGAKKHDSFRIGFRFNGNERGVYPYSFNSSSSKGIDINHGNKFKQNARIVFSYMEMDKDGTRIEMHLGAAETIGAILTLAEEIARATGKPVQRCHQCYELAHLPPVRLAVEGLFRASIMRQVQAYTPLLHNMNVHPRLITSWKAKESCRISAAESTRQCRLKENGNANIRNCIQKVEQKMNSCLK